MSAYQKHIHTSVAFYTHCDFDNSLSELKIYREKDCIEWHRVASFIHAEQNPNAN